MDFDSLIARVGKPSLFTIIATGKNGLIAKALDAQRPEAVNPSEQVSTLKDIGMYTHDGEVPLRNVFASLSIKFQGQQGPSHKADLKELKNIFSELLPNYDTERVYDGDIRKVFKWYNQLANNGFNSADKFAAKTDPAHTEDPAEDLNPASQPEQKLPAKKPKSSKK